MYAPVPLNLDKEISLDIIKLPQYALRTTSRILIALVISITVSIIYALIAVKSERLRKIMIPFIDIMQSIPILGYISFTITGFIALFPGNVLGFELAVIFAVFTCQVWNITYSLYQSFLSVPNDLRNTQKIFKLNAFQRFFLIELPFATPSLVWNAMISVSNSWFFVVASEAMIEGNQSYYLPGIGSYIASAINTKNTTAIYYAIIAMIIIISLYNLFIFNPINDWAAKFKYDDTKTSDDLSLGYKIFSHSKLFLIANFPLKLSYRYFATTDYKDRTVKRLNQNYKYTNILQDLLWYFLILTIFIYSAYSLITFIKTHISLHEATYAFYLGFITTIRIICTISLTILFWLPVSIYIGSKPKILKIFQPLVLIFASFPANIIFPVCALLITKYHLNPNIWLSTLLIISMQWYLVFNILSGMSSFPINIQNVITMIRPKKLTMLKKILVPSILPHFMVGAITAWGSAWNSTIVAEYTEWGNTPIEALGIGSYITMASNTGDTSRIILGILVMLFYIELFNRLMWRPLFRYTDKLERLK
jgi:NitT/TauT family transport system permease protein